jgi:hypothetical protein
MRGVPQASLSRLPKLESGLRWSSFLPTCLTRGRRRRPTESPERFGSQRRRVVSTDSQTQLSRQWLRRF